MCVCPRAKEKKRAGIDEVGKGRDLWNFKYKNIVWFNLIITSGVGKMEASKNVFGFSFKYSYELEWK